MQRGSPESSLPVGAELQREGGVHYRVWAPNRRGVDVVLEEGPGAGETIELIPENDGYFSGVATVAGVGTLYRFRLDGKESYPDPVSRYQPKGSHGPSQVIDPNGYAWTDQEWKGCGLDGQVIYELHVGTFTPEGTWECAARQLSELAELGITVIEVMPVAEFPGRFGWGYDGVNLFAPTRLYGTPDEFRNFIDRAHALGIGVILDVVYNHIGPDGNYLPQFSKDYFTDRYANEWGEAINFDGERSGPVREFFVANAHYWIEEFHLDGLRLDATQQIFDSSDDHILAAITRAVREAARGRETLIVAENEEQHSRLVRSPEIGGYGIDGLWNDDFHHSARVALTGRNEAYYSDYRGLPQEFISAAKYGYLYQGQRYAWQKKPRGTPSLEIKPQAFVTFIQNHDQVANSAKGERIDLLSSPGRLRAMTALFLLGPGTPMLFQGQEFGSSAPFLFFADHNPELANLVHEGRRKFLAQFPSIAQPEMQEALSHPEDPSTFEHCKLDFSERQKHAQVYALHRDLLRLRKDDPVFRVPRPRGVDGAVLGIDAFVLRFFGGAKSDRLLLVNFGRDEYLKPAPEPLLAPPEDSQWETLWSSADPRYGGHGTVPFATDDNWLLPGESAIVLVGKGNSGGGG